MKVKRAVTMATIYLLAGLGIANAASVEEQAAQVTKLFYGDSKDFRFAKFASDDLKGSWVKMPPTTSLDEIAKIRAFACKKTQFDYVPVSDSQFTLVMHLGKNQSEIYLKEKDGLTGVFDRTFNEDQLFPMFAAGDEDSKQKVRRDMNRVVTYLRTSPDTFVELASLAIPMVYVRCPGN